MSETDLSKLDRDALVALVLKQAAVIDALRTEVESLKRSGKRQAAPFSKGTRVERPKRPGRKPGEGTFKRREAPRPEDLSEPPIDVPVVEPDCPKWGKRDRKRGHSALLSDVYDVAGKRGHVREGVVLNSESRLGVLDNFVAVSDKG